MFSKFQHLKPWFTKKLKDWNMCTCQYDTEFNELRIGLDTMQVIGKDVHIRCVCKCETYVNRNWTLHYVSCVILPTFRSLRHSPHYGAQYCVPKERQLSSIKRSASWVTTLDVVFNCLRFVHKSWLTIKQQNGVTLAMRLWVQLLMVEKKKSIGWFTMIQLQLTWYNTWNLNF